MGESPDWIGLLIIQNLFDDTDKHGYVSLARETLKFGLETYDRIQTQLKPELESKPPVAQRPLGAYVGKYYNQVGTFSIHVTEKNGELWMNFQGNPVESYRLLHYNQDEYTWHMTRNEQIERGRNPITYAEYWKIRFDCEGTDDARNIFWVIEADLPGDGTELVKDTGVSHDEV